LSRRVNPKIVVDSREASKQPRIVEGLRNLGVEVKTELLEAGDFYIPAGEKSVLVERKTPGDFVGSVRTRRLWDEIEAMKRAEARPLLLIEGSLSIIEQLTDWAPTSVAGIINSIMFDWQIPIIILPSRKWTTIYLATLSKELITPKTRIYPLRTKPKVEKLEDYPQIVLEGLPDISAGRAKKLLETFGSVRSVVNAGIDELKEVPGIGEKIAEKIWKVVNWGFC